MYRVLLEDNILWSKESFGVVFSSLRTRLTVYELGNLLDSYYSHEDFEILTHLGLIKFYHWRY